MRFRLCCAVLVLASSCSVDLAVPDDVLVTCESDADCPDDSQCNPLTKTCAKGQGNLAPDVSAAEPDRALREVELDLLVRDGNAAPFGDDRVSLAIAYSLDQTTWCPASSVTGVSDLEASSAGVGYLATLDLLGELAGGCGLVARQADTDGDEIGDLDLVAYAPAFAARLTPIDDGSPALEGAAFTTSVIGVGNDAPVAALELEDRIFRGDLPIAFQVTDSAFDPAGIQVQFQLSDADPWQDARLRVGVVSDIATDGRENVVVWDSAAPTALGGIGARNILDVGLRLRAYDEIGGVRDYGPWSTTTVAIDNQTAPVVQGIFAQGGVADPISGVVTIEYRLADEENDLTDIAVEFVVDDEVNWTPCTEYPDELSHGRYNLSTLAGPGVRHVFRWDSIADLGNGQPNIVRLRIQASDGLNTPLPATSGAVSGRVGILLGSGGGFGRDALDDAGANESAAVGDFNGDGFADTIVPTTAGLSVRLGSMAGASSADILAVSTDRARVVVGRLNADNVDDVLVRIDGTQIRPYFGVQGATDGGATFTFGGTTNISSTPDRDLAVGDFDGDGDRDFVFNDSRNVRMYVNNGAGVFIADPNTYALPTDIFEMAAGDLDGDGFTELVTASRGPDDVAAPLMVWFGRARVSGGSALEPPVQVTTLPYYRDPDASFDEEQGIVLAIGRVNQDAFADLGVSTVQFVENGRTSLFLGNAGRVFPRVFGNTVDGRATSATFGDTDGDGRAELIVSTDKELISIERVVDNGEPLLQRTATLDATCVGPYPIAIAAGDVDGDRRADVLAARRSCSDSLLFRPQPHPPVASGAFGRQVTNSATEVADELEVADMDSDGLYDAVWVSRESDAVFAFEASGDLTRATGLMRLGGGAIFDNDIGTGLRRPYIADIDGDGVLDGASYDSDSQLRQILLRSATSDGLATFGFEPRLEMQGPAFQPDGGDRFDALDLDDDGIPELVEIVGGVLSVHRPTLVDGVWQGSYTRQAVTTGLPSFSPRIHSADLNNDGVRDLLVAGNNGTTSTFQYVIASTSGGLPTGAFTVPCATPPTLTGQHFGLAVADVNEDGLQDLIVPRVSSGSTFLRAYNITLTGPCSLAGLGVELQYTAETVSSMVVGDVNHDGVVDVLGVAGSGATRSVRVATALRSQDKGTGGFSAFANMGTATRATLARFADANRDGVGDLFLANEFDVAIGVSPGNRTSAFDAWTRGLGPQNLLGAAVALGSDRFGNPKSYRLVYRNYSDARPHLTNVHSDFMSELRASRLPSVNNAKLRPLSRATELAGDISLGSDPEDERRYKIIHKLGVPEAPGLSLDDPTLPRGLAVTLPVMQTLSGVPLVGAGARPVLVYVRSTDWVRASEWPSDPLYQDPRGDDLLPLSSGRAVFREITRWEYIPADDDGDIATGSGPRFVVRPGFIDVALDTLGVVQVFYIAP